jgi:AcrR family transcriptional regulator
MQRKMENPADDSLPDRLIEAGERLVAEHGLAGFSLRQVNLAAGSKNSSAVQYHFGDSAGLIRAIVAKRVPEFELRRARLLAGLDDVKNADTRSLVEVIYRPFFEIDPVAARFGLQLRILPPEWQSAVAFSSDMDITWRVIDLLAERNPHVPASLLRQRLDRLAFLILSAAAGPRTASGRLELDDATLDDTFRMAAAALSAPLPD